MSTYILALYDENLKPGPASERVFGLFRPDQTMTYDVRLSKTRQTPSTVVSSSLKPPTIVIWCFFMYNCWQILIMLVARALIAAQSNQEAAAFNQTM